MCGIFGLIGAPWRDSAPAALDSLRSRGPDDSALVDLGDAILGHTRLAVVDLVSGQQPMRTADGRYTIVFNGEIYNFRELRKELEGAGRVFTTKSDTEVLLQGFAAWGERVVPRLDGMFAFAARSTIKPSATTWRSRRAWLRIRSWIPCGSFHPPPSSFGPRAMENSRPGAIGTYPTRASPRSTAPRCSSASKRRSAGVCAPSSSPTCRSGLFCRVGSIRASWSTTWPTRGPAL